MWGVKNGSRGTLGRQVLGRRKPVSELGVNLTMNYWAKETLIT
jgi:hypothetical protein